MPIRPEERNRYPKDWDSISRWVRFDRAVYRCECDGRCGHDHGGRCNAMHNEKHPITKSVVVLTVAHLDHTPENSNPENLLAMCQRCHLAYDSGKHYRTRRHNFAVGDLFEGIA